MSETLPPVVQAIKNEMERRELNAVALATLADMSVSNVYGILNGTVNPTLDSLERLTKAMKLKLVAQ